ncbi:MAG: L-glyceraldehyde 3-phosphate reductase [Clostridiales bacterium]|nr:L-glyceraldehyde 3-phosphate reductase [Clostridiales bacterium]
MAYIPNGDRYSNMKYNRCGKSGLQLPAISLGCWHNFGYNDSFENMRQMTFTAFDLGVTHFDLANNYGPPPGSAEENFGKILKQDLKQYRDEMIISTKAGFRMWPGPYGDWGSRKYLLASLDQSLKRMGLDYVDIFYSHRPDPDTPMEETMYALDSAVRQGKALYVGISNYTKEQTERAYGILKELKTPFVIHQPSYSMFNRWIETDGLKDYAHDIGIGIIVYSPLAQGLLTTKYINGIPRDSRMGKQTGFLSQKDLTEDKLAKIKALNEIAARRGQSLAQLALVWVLRDGKVTSALIGASRPEQIAENVRALDNPNLSDEEINEIETILNQ